MSTPDPFANKTIWVTGGAGYLGSPTTSALDAAGAETVCIELPGKADKLVSERGLKRTIAVSLDLTDLAAQRAAVPRLVAEHGAPDGLVHLPFVSSSGKKMEDISTDDMNRTLTGALTPAFEF